MSGISGSLPLYQITIPGTHDSGMSNTGSRTQLADFAVLTLVATEIGKRWAKTQDLDIDEQLDVGVRMLDIRITDTKPDTMSKGDGGLWVCHGKNVAGRALSFVYYPKVASGKRTGGEEYLTFDKVMRYCTDFLSKHPTETILLQVNREQGSGDDAVIWQRANGITGKWASAVNPSTGKSYVYKQPDTGSDWHITSMPKLEDVRGQIVLVTPDVKSYNYWKCLDTLNGWSVHGNVAGVSMAFENHYEVDRATKADYVQAFYGGDSTEKGEKFPYAQEGKIDSKLPYNGIDHVVYVNTSSNGFTTANGSPVHIADYVNDVLFTLDEGDGPFFDDTRGSFLGWLNVDFVTEQITKKIWISNYPKGGLEYTKITFKPGEGVGDEKTYNMQRGTEVRLPKCMYSAPEGSGLAFQGWNVEGMTQYGLQQPGQTFSATENSYWIEAKYTQSWRSIARLIAKAPQNQETVINLRNDITATDFDTALMVGKGSKVVINLNGHTINRNTASQNSDFGRGSAIICQGSLTVNGPGTITGGSAVRGGGINVRSGDVTLKDVKIENNCASMYGGGIACRTLVSRAALRRKRPLPRITFCGM